EAVELEEHLSRVASLCLGIGSRLSLDDKTRAALVQAALVHDLGKLAVPRDLLMKPSALTREEQPVMRGHVSAGVQLLRAFGVSGAVVGVVAAHHERWDGTGYPAGLAGEAIPLEARILAVADAYEAMTAGRPYHAPRSPGEALAELRRQAGSQFDPRCVQACFLELAATQEPAESTASA
ncbi:MAG: HD-GYP domain-containing protein, partial [Armatimonadetes bacterium]|nr:HD-GYP domain-containing protein [Armatimonadota bacterium]